MAHSAPETTFVPPPGRNRFPTTGRGLARLVAALASADRELWPASVDLEASAA
jgi:hypothetical protein